MTRKKPSTSSNASPPGAGEILRDCLKQVSDWQVKIYGKITDGFGSGLRLRPFQNLAGTVGLDRNDFSSTGGQRHGSFRSELRRLAVAVTLQRHCRFQSLHEDRGIFNIYRVFGRVTPHSTPEVPRLP
jgi:hypothetical protein